MKTVLIIDDASTDRLLAGQVVTAHGARPTYAEDGEVGLARARDQRPDLILLDVVMPKIDGYQTCRKLKTDPVTKAIPVVLVTSKGSDSDRFWGTRQGAAEVLCKPYTPAQLRELLGRLL